MLKEVDFLSVGKAFSLDSAVAAKAAMAKSARRGWKAAPTDKKATAQVCGWQVQGSQFTVEKAHLNL
jgi:hypothetical protein